MKSTKVKALSILLSLCMLGSSPVYATDFTDDTFSAEESLSDSTDSTDIFAGQAAPDGESPLSQASDSTSALEAATDDFQEASQTDETAFMSDEDVFSSLDQTSEFGSDVEEQDEENSENEEEFSEISEEQLIAGPLTADAQARSSQIVEADIDSDPSVSTTCTIYEGKNLEEQNYSVWSAPVYSYLTTSPSGDLMRVQSGALDGQLLIEYYDTAYNLKSTMTLELTLPYFGGFYESADNYYILTGAPNKEQNNDQEVYRVSKYTKDWKSLGSCGIFGANTVVPFASGSARMTMYGNYLFVRTCHKMYKAFDGYNHQANVTFSVDTSTMNIVDKFTSVMNSDVGYVSHSFNQFIQIDNGTLLGVDHGDAYPREACLLKYPTDISSGLFVPNYSNPCEKITFMAFPGEDGNNYTGASIGGFEYSDSSYLVAGNYDADDSGSTRNVFISSVPKSGGAATIRYFSDYAGTDDYALTPHLVKTGSNSFILLWSSQGYVYYTQIDGTGQQVGTTYKMAGNLSDCVPSIINGKLIWYTWKNEFNTFYEINLSDLSVNKAVKIENGHKYIYDSNVTTDGLTTETCTVCGKTETVALPVKIALYKKGPGDSSFYLQQKDSFPLTIDDSVQLVWNPSVADGDSTYKKIYDCEISSTDDSILSITAWPSSKIVTMTAHKQGTAAIIIQSKYNPNAVLKVNVYVNTINEQTSSMSLSSTLFHYDGEEHTPTVTLKSGNKTLTEGTDFEVSYEGDLVNAGTVTVTATGIGSYTGSISKTYKIDTRSISNARVSVAPAYYTGFEVTPEVTVTYEDEILVLDRDYTVVYQNNINRYSNSRVGIQGIGNYTGYMTKSFSILQGDISNFTVTLSQDSLEYTGFRLIPDVTVASEYGELKKNTDYYVSASNNTNAGTATLTISGSGNYTGSIKKEFTITPADINQYKVIPPYKNPVYTGEKIIPTLYIQTTNCSLVKDTDYTVTYENNIDAGTATAIFTGIGNYTGTVKQDFTIEPFDFSRSYRASLSSGSFNYDGTAKTPEVTVADYDENTLTQDTDFTVSYSDNVNPGTVIVTITGKGNYTGTITTNFTIVKADTGKDDSDKGDTGKDDSGNNDNNSDSDDDDIDDDDISSTPTPTPTPVITRAPAKITAPSKKTLNQSTKKIAIITKVKTDGKITLKSSNSKIVKVSGTKIIPVNPGKATITIKTAKTKKYNAATKKVVITVNPLAPSTINVKSKARRQATVSWKKVKSVSGYQIYYSHYKTMKGAKHVNAKASAKTATLKKLTSKKKYYIRIRAYKTVSGKKYFSAWSKIKTVSVK